MPDFQVSLSDSANEFIQGQIALGIYRTPSEALSAFVEQAQKRAASEKLLSMIQEGLDSPAIEVTDEWLEQHRRELLTRIGEGSAE